MARAAFASALTCLRAALSCTCTNLFSSLASSRKRLTSAAFSSASTRASRQASCRSLYLGGGLERHSEGYRAGLSAAREDRLWEKRCAAYEESIAGLLRRKEQRRAVLEDGEMEKWPEQQLVEFIVSYAPPDAARVQALARLVPYASDAVVEAVVVCGAADTEVWKACALAHAGHR